MGYSIRFRCGIYTHLPTGVLNPWVENGQQIGKSIDFGALASSTRFCEQQEIVSRRVGRGPVDRSFFPFLGFTNFWPRSRALKSCYRIRYWCDHVPTCHQEKRNDTTNAVLRHIRGIGIGSYWFHYRRAVISGSFKRNRHFSPAIQDCKETTDRITRWSAEITKALALRLATCRWESRGGDKATPTRVARLPSTVLSMISSQVNAERIRLIS